jgi:hypothetical protein
VTLSLCRYRAVKKKGVVSPSSGARGLQAMSFPGFGELEKGRMYNHKI